MYSIGAYGDMIGDGSRMRAYAQALRAAVKPGCVVADIGAGTGIFALLACRFGARRVYAIEPGDAIHLGREIAADNGLAESIEFIQALSTEATLPERADVIVSDLRGVLPLHERHIAAIVDARRRFLAPHGTMIALRDTLWLACVEAENLHAAVVKPWAGDAYGLDMSAALKLVTNQWIRADVKPAQLLTQPGLWARIDYREVEAPDFSASLVLAVARMGTAHGFCGWFDAELAEDVGFSTAPGEPELVYGRAYFPWPHAVRVEGGDRVRITLSANLVNGNYVWRWASRIEARDGACRAEFDQSSFFGEPLSPAKLRKQSAAHVAALNDEGRIDRLALEMMHGGARLEEIARALAREFPARFAGWHDALARVGELSARYSR